jgi:hypothetical protein
MLAINDPGRFIVTGQGKSANLTMVGMNALGFTLVGIAQKVRTASEADNNIGRILLRDNEKGRCCI